MGAAPRKVAGSGRGRRSGAPLLALALLVAATAATAADAPPGSALATNGCAPTGELRGDPARGKALHLEHCAECHGLDGKAEVIVMHMDTTPKDQSDAAYMKTLPDAYLYLAICKGGQDVGKNFVMPAWGPHLSDRDIRDLVAWVRTFSGT
jgi:mono/diheme cytochrome c family protein